VPSSEFVMQHFLNNTDFPAVFYKAAETHSASFETDALLILQDGI
jgi:hypothetical protein